MSSENFPSKEPDKKIFSAEELRRIGLQARDLAQSKTNASVEQILEELGLLEGAPGKKREHNQLEEHIRAAARGAVIDLAGFRKGKPQDPAIMLEDIQTVRAMESPLVVDPVEVKAQMAELKKAIEAADGDSSQIDARQYSKFSRVGGHANLSSIATLAKVMRKGYIMILRYPVNGEMVPGGYIYGLKPTPIDDDDFPTLDIESITLEQEKIERFKAKAEKITTNWRTGVPEAMRKWGGGTALKLAGISMAEADGQDTFMLNIGTMQYPEDLLDYEVEMPNLASDKYNREFLERSNYYRRYFNPVILRSPEGVEEVVANIRWRIYWNSIDRALKRLKAQGGVLLGKGGWDTAEIQQSGVMASDAIRLHYEDILSMTEPLLRAA